MLDFFAVITKGGLVLWYFQDAAQKINTSIAALNALIRNVILQERGGLNVYNHENLSLKMRMDNEFDLMFVAIYQKILQLSYVDKFLSDIHREFRDRYKEPLEHGLYYQSFDFTSDYHQILFNAEEVTKLKNTIVRAPRTFEQSDKSKKTVDSMIEKRPGEKPKKQSKKKEDKSSNVEIVVPAEFEEEPAQQIEELSESVVENGTSDEKLDPKEEIRLKLEKLQKRGTPKALKTKSPKPGKKGKEARIWELDGRESATLDYSKQSGGDSFPPPAARPEYLPDPSKVGTLRGNLQGMDDTSEKDKKPSGVFSMFKSLVGGKVLSATDMQPVLEKLKDHLIGKNVASEIAQKLCQSVESKLEGKHIGTFEGVTSLVRTTLTDALVQLLTPREDWTSFGRDRGEGVAPPLRHHFLRRERSWESHQLGQDFLLADRKQLPSIDRRLRHLPSGGCGAAPDAYEAFECPSPAGETRRNVHGRTLRTGLWQGRG
ncbi:UNVERIFIED_CONTAM: hypothetical protein GTU68_005428 [Idotea baltica]|nr:hypothetical protein [Idotea baltica]